MEGDLRPRDHHDQNRHDKHRLESGVQAAGGYQNIAQLLRCRREGRIPSSTGAGVLGGQTSARSASAAMRGAIGFGGGRSPFGFRRSMMEHPSMISRLGHATTMRGHSRCVNRLCWNDGGTRIASGSDDKTVCLFDAASGNRDLQFDTGHRRNILGLKILPCTNDQVIVTGAMDGEVRLHTAPFTSQDLTECFLTHGKRIHAIEVEPGNPFVFWSASDDGAVRQFDRRLRNSSSGNGGGPSDGSGESLRRSQNADTCLVRIPPTLEGEGGDDGGGIGGHRHSVMPQGGGRALHLACNPIDTHYLAVACGDRIARVFDRRVLTVGGDAEEGCRSSSSVRSRPVLAFCPPHDHPAAGGSVGSSRNSLASAGLQFLSVQHSTCVAYSPNGQQLLVSYHRDHVYLFDAAGSRRSSTTTADRALSSYFMPPPPRPPPTPPVSPSSGSAGVGVGGLDTRK